jgi:O-antigen/teichoic acid export membrane protein
MEAKIADHVWSIKEIHSTQIWDTTAGTVAGPAVINSKTGEKSGLRLPSMLDLCRNPDDALGFKAASGVGWNVAGVLVRSAAAFCINIVLARLLGPQPFGIVALSMVVITLGNLLVDSGLSVQLVREPAVSPKFVRNVFTLQLLLGIILASGIILSTPRIAGLLRQSDTAPVIRALALMLVIVSAGQPSMALLRRELRFKTIQKIQILSYLMGYGVLGLPLAFAGAGVWALVWAQLVQASLGTILSYSLVRHSVVPLIAGDWRRVLRFGSFLAGSNVASWSIGAIPNFVIGRTLGAGALGFYSRASVLTGLPAAALIPPVQTVALSLFSRLQGDPVAVRRTLLSVISVSALAIFPLSLLIAGSAHAVVQVVLGTAWLGAVAAFTPLACAICLDSLAAICSTFLVSYDRPDLDFRTQAITSVFGAGGLFIAALSGASVGAIAWTVCIGLYLVRAVAAAGFAGNVAGVSSRQFGSALRPGVLLAAIVFSTAQFIEVALGAVHGWLSLAVSWSGAVCVCVIVVLLIPHIMLYPDLFWSIRRSGAPIPRAMSPWLDRLHARTRRTSPSCGLDELT